MSYYNGLDFSYPITSAPGYNLPNILFNFGVPRKDVFDYNIFNYTGNTNFPYLGQQSIFGLNYYAPINLTLPGYDIFYNSTDNWGIFDFLRPKPTVSQPSTNQPFGFLTTRTNTPSSNPISKQNYKPGKTSSVNISGLPSSTVAEDINGHSIIKYSKGIALQNLNPDLKEKLIALDKKAKNLGYTLVVSDGWRSHEAQRAAKQRKPNLAATPGKSAHEYGAALDLALYKDGKHIDIGSVKEFYEYAESLGLEWGGRWKKPHETWHFNLQNWRTRADIASEYRRYNNLA